MRSKLVVKNIKHFEIAASQKSLLAMTIQDFFSKLLVNKERTQTEVVLVYQTSAVLSKR